MFETTNSTDRLAAVWKTLSSADRFVLLGHDRPELSTADRIRLARVAGRVANRYRNTEPHR